MALIKCPECGNDISDTCDFCIHCGFKLKKNDILTNSSKPVEVVLNYSEILVHRNNNVKSVKTLVWGIVLSVLFSITLVDYLVIINNINTFNTFGLMVFLIILIPSFILLVLCFVLFGVNNKKTKLHNQIEAPLVIKENGEIIAYDMYGKSYNNVSRFSYDGSELYAHVDGKKIFLGWMSDTREFQKIYR